jgi:hypothetical protein
MTRYAVVMNQLIGTKPEASANPPGALPKRFWQLHASFSPSRTAVQPYNRTVLVVESYAH